MNKEGHVINAVFLSVGIGIFLNPELSTETVTTIFEVGIPIIVGALFPDIDSVIGVHRKTLHNLPVLVGFIVFPLIFGNLYFVWIGVFTHYVLDLLGTTQGLALFYPYSKMFNLPVGVPVDSRLASVVTLIVTGLEIAVLASLLNAGYGWVLQSQTMADIVLHQLSTIGIGGIQMGIGG